MPGFTGRFQWMAAALKHLNWDDMTDYLPAIVTAFAMPFTFYIATDFSFINIITVFIPNDDICIGCYVG